MLVNADEHGGYESDREVYGVMHYKRELETLKDYIHSYACNPDFNRRDKGIQGKSFLDKKRQKNNSRGRER